MIQGNAPTLLDYSKSVYETALQIYGIIHQMYVCCQSSEVSMDKVKVKFIEEKAYGVCPRV